MKEFMDLQFVANDIMKKKYLIYKNVLNSDQFVIKTHVELYCS